MTHVSYKRSTARYLFLCGVRLPSRRRAAAAQVLEQALGQSVVASAETGQLWVSRATQPAGAPLSEVWRAAAVLDVLPQHLAWLADLLMVANPTSSRYRRNMASSL